MYFAASLSLPVKWLELYIAKVKLFFYSNIQAASFLSISK
jgi:hypothetical protein